MEVVLFPAMVTVVEGVIVRFPVLSVPVQNPLPREALFRAKELPGLPGPPVVLFQVTWTLRTVIESWGFVIVILIVLLLKMIEP